MGSQHRILYTSIIFLGHLTFGLLTGIGGPSLVDFQYLITSSKSDTQVANISEISFSLTFVMIGGIVGSFLSFAYKWKSCSAYINRQLATSLLIILFGVSSALTPQISTLGSYYSLGFLAGLGCGNWNTVSTTWLMDMWSGKRLASLLQALQLMYGLGSILGPLLSRPYLSGYMEPQFVSQEAIDVRRRNLTIPYAICGAVECSVGLILLGLFFFDKLRYEKPQTLPQNDPTSYPLKIESHKMFDLPANQSRKNIFFPLILFIMAAYNLCEIGHFSFQNTYFQSLGGVNISAGEAAGITSIMATSYTVGRGASVLVSTWISSANLVTAHLGFGLASFVTLHWTQSMSQLAISVNSAMIGYAFSATTPALFSYVNTYIQVDDRRNAILFVTLGLPSVFTPLLVGPYIESFPSILLYLDLISISIAFTLFLVVRCLVGKSGGKGGVDKSAIEMGK